MKWTEAVLGIKQELTMEGDFFKIAIGNFTKDKYWVDIYLAYPSTHKIKHEKTGEERIINTAKQFNKFKLKNYEMGQV